MAFYRKQGGTNIPATPRRRSGASWVVPGAVRRRLGTTWVSVWSPLNVTAQNVEQSVFLNEPAPLRQTLSGYANPVVTGSSSYTASWSYVSGSTDISCSNTSILNPVFSATLPKNSTAGAVWRLTVLDTASGMTKTVDVTIFFLYQTDSL